MVPFHLELYQAKTCNVYRNVFLCWKIHESLVDSPNHEQLIQSFGVLFVINLSKLLIKQLSMIWDVMALQWLHSNVLLVFTAYPHHIYGYRFCHDDVIKWKHFQRHWSLWGGIHRSPLDSTHKGQRQSFGVSFGLRMEYGWAKYRFATPSPSLLRYYNVPIHWSYGCILVWHNIVVVYMSSALRLSIHNAFKSP